jgi:hypothetical protein
MNRSDILQKLAVGELTVQQATEMLEKGDEQPETATASASEPAATAPAAIPAKRKNGIHWLHVQVTDIRTQRDRVRVNVPVGLIKAGLWIGSRFTDEIPANAWEEIQKALDSGETGALVEVEDFDNGERVRVYVD